MRPRAWIGLLVALVLGGVLVAHPVTLVTITADSMAPTVQPGESILVVRSERADTGDVVTFWSAERGAYTTHRVVDVTEAGLHTRGDANARTDQATGSPPVPRSRVVGPALTVDGTLVVLPPVVGRGALDGDREILVGFGALAVLAGAADAITSTRRVARRPTVGTVLNLLLLTALVTSVGALALSGERHALTYVATEGPTDAPRAVPVGEPTTQHVTLDVAAPPFTTTLVAGRGLTVRKADGAYAVRVPARESPGVIRGTVVVSPYLRTLPHGALWRLHAIHPLLACLGSVLPVFLPVGLLAHGYVDRHTVLRLPTSRRLRRRWEG